MGILIEFLPGHGKHPAGKCVEYGNYQSRNKWFRYNR